MLVGGVGGIEAVAAIAVEREPGHRRIQRVAEHRIQPGDAQDQRDHRRTVNRPGKRAENAVVDAGDDEHENET